MSVQVREIGFQELGLIRPLFSRVFKADLPDSLLAWKYGDGRGRSYGAFTEEGELVAHCGLFYRQTLAEGVFCRIAQLGDLMALPGRHGGVSRGRSPFALLIQQVLADLPAADNPDALAFGFPSDRAMRLGEHLGLFAAIDQVWELQFSPLPLRSGADHCSELDPADRSATRIADRLWRQMAKDLGGDLIGVRDGSYLRHRYGSHPQYRYRLHLVCSRWLRRPVGLLVTRLDGEQCELLDLIAPRPAMERLLVAARQQLASWGGTTLKLWLTGRHAALLQHQADHAVPLEFRIMANPFSSGNRPQRFAGRWWLTSGDTDYR